MGSSIGILIPTYKPGKMLERILPVLATSWPDIPILVVDSKSEDGSVEYAQSMGARVIVIEKGDFNHGLTREFGRKQLNTDIVVMMTQDVIPESPFLIEKLTDPIVQGKAAVSYGRQIPHHGADFFEAFPRDYNYPNISNLRGMEDVKKLGVYTFFCSDSFAAWDNKALDRIGGFQKVLLGEDTLAVASLLRAGFKIAYVADAVVRHSHAYSAWMEMKRYFDTGYQRKKFKDLIWTEAGDEPRGLKLTLAMFGRLWREDRWRIPMGFAYTFAKYIGYWLGKNSGLVPRRLKPYLSSQPYYWQSS